MYKRTAGVSCSLKDSSDGLEIIVCGKMFHCTIVCEKNDHLYVSFCVLLSVGMSMLFPTLQLHQGQIVVSCSRPDMLFLYKLYCHLQLKSLSLLCVRYSGKSLM